MWEYQEFYVEPWPRIPRKTKKIVGFHCLQWCDERKSIRKEHRRDRKRLANYLDRRVK
jgi:hypothetical protein